MSKHGGSGEQKTLGISGLTTIMLATFISFIGYISMQTIDNSKDVAADKIATENFKEAMNRQSKSYDTLASAVGKLEHSITVNSTAMKALVDEVQESKKETRSGFRDVTLKQNDVFLRMAGKMTQHIADDKQFKEVVGLRIQNLEKEVFK